MSVFSNFSALDELIQVIYQNINKFVLLSNVSDDEWTVHLGQAEDGRWWRGAWREGDVTKLVGSNTSELLLESFAEKLSDSIIKGDVYVKDLDSSGILVLGPSSKKTLNVILIEMDQAEASIYATSALIQIALHAQKRKCQLYPSDIAPDPTPLPSYSRPSASSGITNARTDLQATTQPSTSHDNTARSKEDKKGKDPSVSRPQKPPAATSKPVKAQALKGASLANPNKKARKYQAIEFGSDDD